MGLNIRKARSILGSEAIEYKLPQKTLNTRSELTDFLKTFIKCLLCSSGGQCKHFTSVPSQVGPWVLFLEVFDVICFCFLFFCFFQTGSHCIGLDLVGIHLPQVQGVKVLLHGQSFCSFLITALYPFIKGHKNRA